MNRTRRFRSLVVAALAPFAPAALLPCAVVVLPAGVALLTAPAPGEEPDVGKPAPDKKAAAERGETVEEKGSDTEKGEAPVAEENADDAKADLPKAPSTQPAKVSPAARAELDQIRDAYKTISSLKMSGTVSIDFDVDGQKKREQAAFTSDFQAPNKFRHEMSDDVLVGSTGDKIYAYQPKGNKYVIADAPKDRSAATNLSGPVPRILERQNPSLLLALSDDAARHLCEDAAVIEKQADVKLGEQTFTDLRLTINGGMNVDLLIDPQTHLVRQFGIDMKQGLEARGAQNVQKATYTVDYTDVKRDANAPVETAQFAWAPPEGAKEVTQRPEAAAASALEGKTAPAFSLESLDGNKVSLSDLKGSVVVLDLWATWCVPCRQWLPRVNKIYNDNKGKGLKVFAVNQEDEKDVVQKFVDKIKLTIPVLLDTKSEVGASYGADYLPETVLIGRDGKIKKVFVGFDPDNPDNSERELREAIADALK